MFKITEVGHRKIMKGCYPDGLFKDLTLCLEIRQPEIMATRKRGSFFGGEDRVIVDNFDVDVWFEDHQQDRVINYKDSTILSTGDILRIEAAKIEVNYKLEPK